MKNVVFYLMTSLALSMGLESCVRVVYNSDSERGDTHFTGIEYSIDDYDAQSYVLGGGTLSEPVRSLDIDWLFGNVVLQSWDGQEVQLVESNEGHDVLDSIQQMCRKLDSDGKLQVRFCRPGEVPFSDENCEKELIVRVPAKVKLDRIYINGVDSDVKLSNMNCGQLMINVVSGDSDIEEGEFDKAELTSVSGDVEILDARCKKLSVDNISGDVFLKNIVGCDAISANTVSGDIVVRGVCECVVDVKAIDGDVRFE